MVRITRVTGDPLAGSVRDEDGSDVAIALQIYSAVMDVDTCDACAQWDGKRFRLNATSVQIPNPQCTCTNGCRCCWVFVGQAEVDAWSERDRQVPLLP